MLELSKMVFFTVSVKCRKQKFPFLLVLDINGLDLYL